MKVKKKNHKELKKDQRVKHLLPVPLFCVPYYGAKAEVVYIGKERRMNCIKESLWL